MVQLYQGDCLELMKNIPDCGVDMVFTDIPYGAVNRTSNGLRNLDKQNADTLTFDLSDFLNETYRLARNCVCIFCGKEQFSEIYKFFAAKKGTVRPVVWHKSNPSPMNGQYIYLSGVELAVWFKKSGGEVFNARCKNTVFKYPNGKRELHPTQKNLELITELLLDNTNPGDTILDPCMGSATTGIACVRTGRNFIGMELDDKYYKIASERIAKEAV